MWKEFKSFAFKGNVLDLAVGVIIGGAFGKIVSSVVSDIIMPLFGYMTAGMDFKLMKWVLSPALMEGDIIIKPEAAIMYGNFFQSVVDFTIIAFSIFLFIQIINKTKQKQKDAEAAEPVLPIGLTQEEILIEIRDLLKNK